VDEDVGELEILEALIDKWFVGLNHAHAIASARDFGASFIFDVHVLRLIHLSVGQS
jgi:hypothetical protein